MREVWWCPECRAPGGADEDGCCTTCGADCRPAKLGRRLPDDTRDFRPGDYGRVNGAWQARTPEGHLGNLSGHQVTEHEDGTVTVSPSIRVVGGSGDAFAWHGYLERGVWREV